MTLEVPAPHTKEQSGKICMPDIKIFFFMNGYLAAYCITVFSVLNIIF